jgi:TonB-dependent SusC/RagA subfamily outer membrane receptor
MYLISGILISFLFPFISVHYRVELASPNVNPVYFTPGGNFIHASDHQINSDKLFDYRYAMLFMYLSGVIFFAFRLIWHIGSLYRTIKKANINKQGRIKLIRTSEFSSSFSFFNYIFVNPSVNETEMGEIINHELVHVRQKHWLDLFIIELLRLMQWGNPFAWIYTGFIRLNHEYLADEAALQRTSDPAIYKAALLNQLFSSQVISLSNSFSYSLNKKRFDMMKKSDTSPYRKMKILFILPVIAIGFYSFAKPEYHYLKPVDNTMPIHETQAIVTNVVKGTVLKADGRPFAGVSIIVSETSLREYTDVNGWFVIDRIPDEASLVFSFKGCKTKVLKPVFGSDLTIIMAEDTENGIQVNNTNNPSAPLLKFIKIREKELISPLYVIDGIITDVDSNKIDIDPGSVISIEVLKDKSATDKYGKKGENGVVLITTKKNYSHGNEGKISDVKVNDTGSSDSTRISDSKVQFRNTGENITHPLILLNGVAVDIDVNNIDPNSIETVEVFKDKSATDKYGEKGKDGVIEITTKK